MFYYLFYKCIYIFINILLSLLFFCFVLFVLFSLVASLGTMIKYPIKRLSVSRVFLVEVSYLVYHGCLLSS